MIENNPLSFSIQNCQHNTAGTYCEYCATGYQGDARRATAYDCQPITPPPSQCSYKLLKYIFHMNMFVF